MNKIDVEKLTFESNQGGIETQPVTLEFAQDWRLNRTKVGLKQRTWDINSVFSACLNRTKVGLKR